MAKTLQLSLIALALCMPGLLQAETPTEYRIRQLQMQHDKTIPFTVQDKANQKAAEGGVRARECAPKAVMTDADVRACGGQPSDSGRGDAGSLPRATVVPGN